MLKLFSSAMAKFVDCGLRTGNKMVEKWLPPLGSGHRIIPPSCIVGSAKQRF